MPYGDGYTAGYRAGCDTSEAAAAWVQARLGERQLEVLTQLRVRGEATLAELCHDLGRAPHCVSPRVTELCDRQLVQDTRRRRDNPETGRSMRVYAPVYRCLECLGEGRHWMDGPTPEEGDRTFVCGRCQGTGAEPCSWAECHRGAIGPDEDGELCCGVHLRK